MKIASLLENSRRRSPQRGSALLIVLAMILLLTGLIVAFLFRSGSSLVASGSSANITHADIFGQGAIDTIVGDLKQEIVVGSTSNTVSGYTYYTPSSNQNAIPATALPSGVTQTVFPNLVKMSAASVPFYSNGPTRASASTTTTASLNGSLVSLSSWNKPLLLPKATPSDTYNLAPLSSFVAPNWVLVSRDGSNPTSWDNRLRAIPANIALPAAGTTGQPNPVVGRYAYTIYNEGGLLDANVAGSPVNTSGAPASTMAAYKNALAYADLTQLQDSSNNQLLTATDINALVGWRNYASAQASGSFPGYSFATQNPPAPTPFDLAIMGNTTGFLRTANTALNPATTGQSDHEFLSRQQLIQFLQAADTGNTANMQNVMQYLGTFSRGLDQPSFIPGTAASPAAPTPGLLNDGGGVSNPYASVNPSFLGVTVTTSFTRNDGSTAVVGEPLVKKRFAVNRLAWLTYQGPITLDGTTINPLVPTSIVTALENQYGYSQAFLLQGTPANIYKYFGLAWVTAGATAVTGAGSEWVYAHSSATTPPTAYTAGGTAIMTLGQAAAAGREPDFFELLKAAVAVGSKAVPGVTGTSGPNQYQQQRDASVDYAVIQLGANIIEQAKLDGFPATIAFKGTGGTGQTEQFFAAENLPYLYRIRNGAVEAETPSPTSGNAAITDIGAIVVLQQPDIWNPYDVNSLRCGVDASGNSLTDKSGNPLYPQNFQVVAYSCAPSKVGSGSYADVWPEANGSNSSSDYTATSPMQMFTFPSVASLAIDGSAGNGYDNFQGYFQLGGANVGLSFQMAANATGNALFREPTVLAISNVGGSNLQPIQQSINKLYQISPAGVKSVIDGNNYLGIYLGVVPVRWNYQTTPTMMNDQIIQVGLLGQNRSLKSPITYCLQYALGGIGSPSSNYYAYDQKYISSMDSESLTVTGGMQTSSPLGRLRISDYIDPRTSRFGASEMRGDYGYPDPYNHNISVSLPPFLYYFSSTTTSPPSPTFFTGFPYIVPSDRPDYAGGFGVNSGPGGNLGFLAGMSSNWNPSSNAASAYFQPGSLSQNSPSYNNSSPKLRYQGDTYPVSGMNVQNTYFADADGVVRPAMGAYAPAGSAVGLPMASTMAYGGWIPTATQSQSRPIILHRPFRSVAEMSYAFSGVPWRNVDFMTPQSGDAGLLDVFCIANTDDPNGLVAGKVDLNTRQIPVLQAILAGAYTDEQNNITAPPPSYTLSPLTSSPAATLAAALVTRTEDVTHTGKGPLENKSELVGRYVSGFSSNFFGGSIPYDGYSADLTSALSSSSLPAATLIPLNNIQRLRESPIRALAACGQTRVWNLMIDVVAQTGRFPASAANLDQFVVDGQQRYWVHLAIDRYTGQVLDKQVETVRE